MNNLNHPLSWCLIKDFFDNAPIRKDGTWEDFIELMMEHTRIPASRGHYQPLSVEYVRYLNDSRDQLQEAIEEEPTEELIAALKNVQEERAHIKNGPAFLPCTYTDNTRLSRNIDLFYFIVFDSDDGMEYSEILNVIEPFEHIAATSFSDLPEKRKWRIVLPLKTPLVPNDCIELFDKFNLLLGGKLDGVGSKKMQLYFLPSCPPDAEPEFIYNEGVLVEPDDLRDVKLPPKQVITPTAIPLMPPTSDKTLTSILDAIPNDDDSYHFWLKIGMAIHAERPYDGCEFWEYWSSKSGKHIPGDCEKKWKTFTNNTGLTMGTLYHLAKQNGWTKPIKVSINTIARTIKEKTNGNNG